MSKLTSQIEREGQYLCVGGPYDGKWYESEYPTFIVDQLKRNDKWCVRESKIPMHEITTDQYRYVRIAFGVENSDKKIFFWAPEKFTHIEVLSLLAIGYKP